MLGFKNVNNPGAAAGQSFGNTGQTADATIKATKRKAGFGGPGSNNLKGRNWFNREEVVVPHRVILTAVPKLRRKEITNVTPVDEVDCVLDSIEAMDISK